MADPWVVAQAEAEGAVVVTKEALTPANAKIIKIPDVCKALSVEWFDDFRLVSELGVSFTAKRR